MRLKGKRRTLRPSFGVFRGTGTPYGGACEGEGHETKQLLLAASSP